MNDTVHGHMVQDLLRHRFGSHDNLICKYSSKYPVQAEREFQRLTNAYIRILNELLKEYLPEIRDAARAEREAGQRLAVFYEKIAAAAGVGNTLPHIVAERGEG